MQSIPLADYGLAALVIWELLKFIKYLISRPVLKNERSHEDIFQKLTEMDAQMTALHQNIQDVATQVTWIKDIHDVKDDDGVPVWYLRRSMEKVIDKLVTNGYAILQGLKDLTKEIEIRE